MKRSTMERLCGAAVIAMAFMAGGLWPDAGPEAHAEVQSIPSISSTSTSAPVQLAKAATDLTIINDAASANESYIRVFVCGEPTLAAVAATAPAMRLEPGNSVSLKWTTSAGGDGGYCALTHVTAAAETATLRVISQ